MLSADVVIAGGGVAGLLLASALGGRVSVILLEQAEELPRNKYWLTDAVAADTNPALLECVDRRYDELEFIAYDGETTRLGGRYCLWDTDRLIGCLADHARGAGVEILTGHRLYSIALKSKGIEVRANDCLIEARLLVDCMGFGSPLVGAKHVAEIRGYYILQGVEVCTAASVRPVALDNVIIGERPTYFEFFPTSRGTAHAALILPSRNYRPERPLRGDLNFILQRSHYRTWVRNSEAPRRSYFGIIPVGRLRQSALDRIIFFGEAGQTNPAASATGLSRMLHTYRDLGAGIEDCLRRDRLRRRELVAVIPPAMTRMNRVFQESVFENLLTFDSDDFRRLVRELSACPSDVINDLVFACFDFRSPRAIPLAVHALLRPRSVLGRHMWRSLQRWLSWR